MIRLLEKAYNCYISFLTNMNYGRVSIPYDILYDSILCLKNDITETKYSQYFQSNLLCPIKFPIVITPTMERMIGWFLNPDPNASTFVWNEKEAPSLTTYYIDVTAKSGFNYLYFSIPQGVNFTIYNTLDIVLFDSQLPDSASQLFILTGTTITSKGATNNVFRKKDVYATSSPITYKIKLY